MSRPIIQKPLGWLQRFLYNVEVGPLPAPTPVIGVEQDWPLEYQRISSTVTTVVGTATGVIYSPGEEKHGLVWLLNSSLTAAGQWPLADVVQVNLAVRGTAVPIIRYEGFGTDIDTIPLIGGVTVPLATGGFTPYYGVAPVYVPAGAQLNYIHASAVAANVATILGYVVERQKSYPLRLPG